MRGLNRAEEFWCTYIFDKIKGNRKKSGKSEVFKGNHGEIICKKIGVKIKSYIWGNINVIIGKLNEIMGSHNQS